MRKAELAVDKKQDDLARVALERSMNYKRLAGSFESLVADQKTEVDNLKSALHKLEQKLAEAESKSDALIAQHRRSRALSKASDAQLAISDKSKVATFERMKSKVRHAEAVSKAKAEMANDNVEDQLAALEKQDEIEKMLKEISPPRRVTVKKVFHFDSRTELYRADACVVSCFDARFELVTRKFLRKRGIQWADPLKIAGGAKVFASPADEYERSFALGQVRITNRNCAMPRRF